MIRHRLTRRTFGLLASVVFLAGWIGEPWNLSGCEHHAGMGGAAVHVAADAAVHGDQAPGRADEHAHHGHHGHGLEASGGHPAHELGAAEAHSGHGHDAHAAAPNAGHGLSAHAGEETAPHGPQVDPTEHAPAQHGHDHGPCTCVGSCTGTGTPATVAGSATPALAPLPTAEIEAARLQDTGRIAHTRPAFTLPFSTAPPVPSPTAI